MNIIGETYRAGVAATSPARSPAAAIGSSWLHGVGLEQKSGMFGLALQTDRDLDEALGECFGQVVRDDQVF